MAANTLDKRIVSEAGVAGGKPHLAGRRITVQNIVVWHEFLGKSADEISFEHDLTLTEIYLALAYYYEHRALIDLSIQEDEQFVTTQKVKIPSKLKQKLRGIQP